MKSEFMDMSESLGIATDKLLEHINEVSEEEKEIARLDHVSVPVEVYEEEGE
jgi:deoxyhypusine synthase